MRTIAFTVYGPTQGYFLSFLHSVTTTSYSPGHSGTLDVEDGTASGTLLEHVFMEGNGQGTGPGFVVSGRSMSTGDVVHLQGLGVWVCDSVGWTQLDPAETARFPIAAA